MSKSIWHGSVHSLFRRMVELGGSWIASDAPPDCIGFCRRDGTEHHVVPLTAVREAWGRCADDWHREWGQGTPLRELIRSPEGRREHIITGLPEAWSSELPLSVMTLSRMR